MKRIIGISCMILGIVLLLGAGALYLMNEEEGNRAEESAQALMPKILKAIQDNVTPTTQNPDIGEEQSPSESPHYQVPLDPDFYSTEMTVEIIDGYSIVGYLSVPSRSLQLPVMADTTDALLKISPCRFSGSTKTDNLVIGGHNYWQHFGQLPELKNGDRVIFTDMDGNQTGYELITMEVLQPNDVEELTKGEYPLTIYTCTYGGASRITLRFDIIKE